MDKMAFNNLESTIESAKIEVVESVKGIGNLFKSAVQPENNAYGVEIKDIGNGIESHYYKTDTGISVKDYYVDGKIQKSFQVDNGTRTVKYYDDLGNDYLSKTANFNGTDGKIYEYSLKPNQTVTHGDYTAITDANGRPSVARIENVQLKETGVGRETMFANSVDQGYDKGHLIADSLGGPGTQENITPQLQNVNRSKFASAENEIKKIAAEHPDSNVSYEVKANYADNSDVPSSFDLEVKVDGKTVELESGNKIYNTTEELSSLDKLKTGALETVNKVSGVAKVANKQGIEMGAFAATVTCAVSTVENVTQFMDGDITLETCVEGIAKDTATAGAVGYGTGFVSSVASQTMKASGSKLISSLGNSAVPAAVISFGVQSFDSVMDYSEGKIGLAELADDLGENAVNVTGGTLGAMAAGAALGSIVPGAGTIVGAGIGMVGGMIGCAVASAAYETAKEVAEGGADVLLDKAQACADSVVEIATKEIPESLEDIKGALNTFARSCNIPLSI